ncbi:nudix hydrolase 26 [Quercus suber]|uniref:Nudix hydrolase 26 n=1 Tax=Quercus suber TaxID=58331 RepID=A0AAW0JFD0_QUESU
MNLRKSHLNRRKLKGKSLQKLLLQLQKQRIRRRNKFLLKFTVKDEEINLLGDGGTEKAEFGERSWISPEQIVELVGRQYLFYFSLLAVDFYKLVYKEVVTVFAPYLQFFQLQGWIYPVLGKCPQFSQLRFYNFVKLANPFRFLLKFTVKDEEINLLGDGGTEKAEFGERSWISPEQIVELAVDFYKLVYKEVVTVFAPYLQ